MAGVEWTNAELKIIEESYSRAEWGIKDMIKLLPNRSAAAIHSRASLMGIKSNYRGRQHTYNKLFWSNFTKETCYWAGFSAADGCISQRKDGGYTFSLTITDFELLEKFAKSSNATYPICHDKNRATRSLKLHVGEEWVNDLKNNFNIAPRKTWDYQAPRQIPSDLFPYFLIGFIDGDGCWHLHKGGKQFCLRFSLATRDVLDWINDWAKANYSSSVSKNKRCREVKRDKRGYYSLFISGSVACQLYLDLRKLIPELHLSRKWDDPAKIAFCENYLSIHKISKVV